MRLFDFFCRARLARASGQAALQIHKPQLAGTDLMDTTVFGTGDDGSQLPRNAGLHFIDKNGLPFALDVPHPIEWMNERIEISTGYPDIVGFAGGNAQSGWYLTPTSASNVLFTSGKSGVAAPTAHMIGTDLTNCAPEAPGGLTAIAQHHRAGDHHFLEPFAGR